MIDQTVIAWMLLSGNEQRRLNGLELLTLPQAEEIGRGTGTL